jgi:hypothetical protein
MSWPKIVYPTSSEAGAGGQTSLTFKWPPYNVSPYITQPVGAEDYASHGAHVAMTERVDHWQKMDMPWIALGSDLTAWQAFLDWAALGGDFDYYPDASQSAYTTFHWPRPLQEIRKKQGMVGLFELMGIAWRQSIFSLGLCDEDYWISPAAPVPLALYQRLPYLPDPSDELL